MRDLERLPTDHRGLCECSADDHGHEARRCPYPARLRIRPGDDIPALSETLEVCSPCEAQWTRVENKPQSKRR